MTNKLINTITAFAFLLSGASGANGQSAPRVVDNNANGWYMYFGDHSLGGRWELHLEQQWRRSSVIRGWQQMLVRPAVNYRLTPNVLLTGGYGFVQTYRYGDYPAGSAFPEHRAYEQLQVRQQIGRADVVHRYRLEQRLIGQPYQRDGVQHNWRYENRFRYMARVTLPLPRVKKLYVAVYDELFVNFGRNVAANLFDQNRAYAALGVRAGRFNRFEFGYMNQLLAQRNGQVLERNHTLQIALFSAVPFRSKH